MRADDWIAYTDREPREDEHPILLLRKDQQRISVMLGCRPNHSLPGDSWLHWMPLVLPKESDTALSLLREAVKYVKTYASRGSEDLDAQIDAFFEKEDSGGVPDVRTVTWSDDGGERSEP